MTIGEREDEIKSLDNSQSAWLSSDQVNVGDGMKISNKKRVTLNYW